MRATEKTYVSVGVFGFGGFMFIASTIWDFYRRTSSPPRTTSYASDVIVNLLIWPLAGYLAGLVCWKLVSEIDGERTNNQPDEQDWTRGDVGSWAGVLLCIILLESHLISRPLVFLLAPFVVLLPSLVIAPIRGKRLRLVCLAAVTCSVVGFALAKYVFH
jgi:nitrate reductase gamma subunit